jgi:NitT/TauT family transport system permease protein
VKFLRPIVRWLLAVLPPLAVLVVGVLALEWAIVHFKVDKFLVPKPSAVFDCIVTNWRSLLASTWVTAKPALIGFGASAVVGVIAAIILASSKWVLRAFYPYTIFFQTVPLVAIAPLLVLWMGFGMKPVAMSAFIVSVFPVIANTLAGLMSVDPNLRDMFRLYRAGPIATLFKLRLPSATPNILTGLRVSAGLAVIGTIVGEFVAGYSQGTDGLGITIMAANRGGLMEWVFAAVLVSSLLGLLLFIAINGLSWLLLRKWHVSER